MVVQRIFFIQIFNDMVGSVLVVSKEIQETFYL